MSRYLLVAALVCGIVAVALVLYVRAGRNASGSWPDGYRADFTSEDSVDPSKNCVGQIYVSCLREPRGVRKESTCGSRKLISIARFSDEFVAVLDPEAKTYWKPQVKNRFEVHTELRTDAALETLNGRAVRHYRRSTNRPDGSAGESEVWEDPRLHAPIREVTAHSKYELTNVREGGQPKELFSVPPGFREIAAPSEGEASPR